MWKVCVLDTLSVFGGVGVLDTLGVFGGVGVLDTLSVFGGVGVLDTLSVFGDVGVLDTLSVFGGVGGEVGIWNGGKEMLFPKKIGMYFHPRIKMCDSLCLPD